MTTSTAHAPIASAIPEAPAEVYRSWDEERDAGVRAFRGILVAAGLAAAFWGGIGAVAWALFQFPS